MALMATKFVDAVSPHAGGVGLWEYGIHPKWVWILREEEGGGPIKGKAGTMERNVARRIEMQAPQLAFNVTMQTILHRVQVQ